MRDTGFLQCFLAAQCEESGQRIRSLELATGLEYGKAISAYEPANVQLELAWHFVQKSHLR